VLELLRLGEGSDQILAVGHRVVHGGEALTQPTLITESVKKAIEKAIPLAPLHNPPNLEVPL
jgi:acetate kinase